MQLVSTKQFGTHHLFLEIARGNVLGASPIHKFGRSDGINSAAAEDIWDWGGTYNFPTAACLVDIESSASSDGDGNGGARTLQIYGLDSNFVEIDETLTLAGQDIVTSTSSYMRLHRMIVRSAGSIGESAGKIVATHRGTTSAVAQVTNGFNQTLMAIYTVPASRTAFLFSWHASIDRAGWNQDRSADLKLSVRPFGELFQTKDTVGLFNSFVSKEFIIPERIAGKSDIKITASATTNNTAVSGHLEMVLLDNAVNF